MNIKKILAVSITTTIALSLNGIANARIISYTPSDNKPNSGPKVSETKLAAQRQLEQTFRWSRPLATGFTEVSFVVADNGKVYDPQITHYSGDGQFDSECLEAVCGLHNLPWSRNHDMWLEHIKLRFGSKDLDFIKGHEAPEMAVFIKTHPLKEGDIIFHKIPLFVLLKCPGLFKPEELTGSTNIGIIPGADVHENEMDKGEQPIKPPIFVHGIVKMNGIWRSWLKSTNPLTRELVLKVASEMPGIAFYQ